MISAAAVLSPTPGDAGQPVAGVAAQGREVGVRAARDAVLGGDPGLVDDVGPADAAGGVEHPHRAGVVDQLEQVAVAGDDVDRTRVAGRQRADDVVGLVAVDAEAGDAQRLEDVLDDRRPAGTARRAPPPRRPVATRCALYDGIASTRKAGRQSSSMAATSRRRLAVADQPGDEVEQAADRVDRGAVRRASSCRARRRRRGSTATGCRAAAACRASASHGCEPARPRRARRPGVRLDWVHDGPPRLARPRVTRPQGRRRRRARRPAGDPGPGPALADRLRRAAAGAAHLPGAARRRASRSSWRPASRCRRSQASPVRDLGVEVRGLGRDRRPVRRGRRPAGIAGAGWRWPTGCGPSRCCGCARPLPGAEQTPGRPACSASCGCARAPTRSTRCAGPGRRSTGCTPGWPSSCGPAAPSARRAARSPPRSWPRATRRSTSSSSASGPNGASPHHEVGDRVLEAGDPVVVDIGGTTPRATARTAPGCTPSARRRPSSPTTSRCCTRPSWPPARTPARASPPSRSTRPPATSSPPPATATRSCTAPGTASASRPTRSPTSSTGNTDGAGAGHGVLDRAGHLPARPARRPDRGHRGRHRRTASSGSTSPTAQLRRLGGLTAMTRRSVTCPPRRPPSCWP